jgi:GxxExxY protein
MTPWRKDAKEKSHDTPCVFAPSRLCVIEGPNMTENEISKHIVEAAIEVHRTLGGPGLLESVYEEALVWELRQRGLNVERQVSLPIPYKGQMLATPLRIDLIVGGLVIVECKAVTQYNAIFEAQTLTYLRLTSLKLGLVINFGERVVKDGIHRVVNGL